MEKLQMIFGLQLPWICRCLEICIYELRSKPFTSEQLLLWLPLLGGAYRFPGFCRNQHIRDPTWSQNPFLLHRLGNRSRSCFDFRCFGDNSVALILHSFHVLFLSFVLISFQFPFIFLSCSFQSAFISFHLPFICMHVLFILHSCPAISFLRL